MQRAGELHPLLAGVRAWVVGGHSMGARAAAGAAAAAGEAAYSGPRVAGALFSSYPVHPPGKPVGGRVFGTVGLVTAGMRTWHVCRPPHTVICTHVMPTHTYIILTCCTITNHRTRAQEQLRDEPLCSLRLPLLFLRGGSDPFCAPGPWAAVRARLASADVEVRGRRARHKHAVPMP